MKLLLLSLISLFSIGTASMADDTSPKDMSNELRSMILNLNPKDVGLTKDNFPHPVFALVMETGFPEGFYTLSSVADGSTSLYFSNGGGIIGGGEHKEVRDASNHLLSGRNILIKQIKLQTSQNPKLVM